MKEKVNLRRLKSFLQRGEIAEIAQQVGISTRQATNIIGGTSTNWQFVELFLARVNKNKSLKAQCES